MEALGGAIMQHELFWTGNMKVSEEGIEFFEMVDWMTAQNQWVEFPEY